MNALEALGLTRRSTHACSTKGTGADTASGFPHGSDGTVRFLSQNAYASSGSTQHSGQFRPVRLRKATGRKPVPDVERSSAIDPPAVKPNIVSSRHA